MDHSLLVTLLATLGIAIIALAWRWLRSRPQDPQHHTSTTAPRLPNAHGAEAAFDPHATRIFLKPSPKAAPLVRKGGATIDGADARLVALSGPHKGKTFDVNSNGRGIILGRQAVCDIQLSDRRVSGRHAWIGIINGKAVLRDLKSTNGTFVNAKMDAPVHQVELLPGDMVVLGGHRGDQFHFVLKDKNP